jgi:hypothetical protein
VGIRSFDQWRADGFQQFAGTTVDVRVPFSDDVINGFLTRDVLPRIPRLRELRIAVHDERQLDLHVALAQPRWLPAFTVPLQLEPDVTSVEGLRLRARITDSLAGTLSPFIALWKDRLPSGITIDGRAIEVALPQLVHDAHGRLILSKLERLHFSSSPGVLWVSAHLSV